MKKPDKYSAFALSRSSSPELTFNLGKPAKDKVRIRGQLKIGEINTELHNNLAKTDTVKPTTEADFRRIRAGLKR